MLLPLFSGMPRQQLPINRLSWLAGCWEWKAGARHGEEQWMKPRGGTMLGMSRTVRNDSTIEFEFVRIEEKDGRLHYVASPSGQTGATFSSIVLTDTTVVFANPAHDFPQRILYTLRGDSLRARIEGTRNGSVRGVDFPMQKVACALR
ncbi:MAG: hypothetical protein H7Z74_02340 [Anaerolineae bacterium]|nr:hypothetical protein [Gemmatimonadaceae bacterium]